MAASPVDRQPSQVAKLNRPRNGIGGDAEGMVDGRDHQVVLLLRHMQPPIRGRLSRRCVEAVQSPDKKSDRYQCEDLCGGLFQWSPRCFLNQALSDCSASLAAIACCFSS